VTESFPLRVAVVGSGPAGFYAAGALLSAKQGIEVDLIERLPTPWGLVRLGVAPDHPNIKAVSRAFEKIAAQDGFRFLGNLDVGAHVTHAELAERYDAVIYSCGAQTDRRMGIAGEDLPGSWPATAFVAWYNGHPDFADLEFDLSGERAVVIGNGNVAVDVARMLCLTKAELEITDTADGAIDAIVGCGLEEILMLGRRGPVQAAFTTPELQELGEMAGADILVDPADLVLDDASAVALEEGGAIPKRNVELLNEYAARAPHGHPRALRLRFLVSPVAILGDGKVEAIEVVKNVLVQGDDGQIRAVATEERETIPCSIVFRSVGYQGVPIEGVPFDDRGAVMPNDGGRVLDPSGAPVPGLYCAGWIKRGPSGVIGTNKKDATETVEILLADAAEGRIPRRAAEAKPIDELAAARGHRIVTYAGWEAIDAAEKAAAASTSRPRVKLTRWPDLLAAAGA